jgi:hypothetical protein
MEGYMFDQKGNEHITTANRTFWVEVGMTGAQRRVD